MSFTTSRTIELVDIVGFVVGTILAAWLLSLSGLFLSWPAVLLAFVIYWAFILEDKDENSTDS